MIAGSVFDPKSSTSVATTWVSGDGEDWKRKDVSPASRDASESFSALVRTATAPWPSVGGRRRGLRRRRGARDGDDWSRIGEGDARRHARTGVRRGGQRCGHPGRRRRERLGRRAAPPVVQPRRQDVHERRRRARRPARRRRAGVGQRGGGHRRRLRGRGVAHGDNNSTAPLGSRPTATSWEQIEAPTLAATAARRSSAWPTRATSSWPAATALGSPVVRRSEDGRAGARRPPCPSPTRTARARRSGRAVDHRRRRGCRGRRCQLATPGLAVDRRRPSVSCPTR